jgi:hypothetical protein
VEAISGGEYYVASASGVPAAGASDGCHDTESQSKPFPLLFLLWTQLEEYLIGNQDEYFDYSSRNYTAEQRKYNNNLTRGLLDLAAEEGYAFEEFTFSMVRDRIRCYYKSHSQSIKKKRRR